MNYFTLQYRPTFLLRYLDRNYWQEKPSDEVYNELLLYVCC